MIKGKVAGLAFGGLAGYLIIGKAFNLIDRSIKNMCDAAKWKAYYKNNRDTLAVPPGYASSTRKIDDKTELVVEDPKSSRKNGDGSKKDISTELADVIVKAVEDWLKAKKEPEEALEGQETVSEEDISPETEKVDDEKGEQTDETVD